MGYTLRDTVTTQVGSRLGEWRLGEVQKTGEFGKEYDYVTDRDAGHMVLMDGGGNILEVWRTKRGEIEPRVHTKFMCVYVDYER